MPGFMLHITREVELVFQKGPLGRILSLGCSGVRTPGSSPGANCSVGATVVEEGSKILEQWKEGPWICDHLQFNAVFGSGESVFHRSLSDELLGPQVEDVAIKYGNPSPRRAMARKQRVKRRKWSYREMSDSHHLHFVDLYRVEGRDIAQCPEVVGQFEIKMWDNTFVDYFLGGRPTSFMGKKVYSWQRTSSS
ncbi:hypothetical protein NE237_017223 [Protea cynaroides]|uniref:Uncharacterized protein n=1 Tax=Protea cynaroides TaxID=273540 RepID=A0A9Q0K7M1_9MAGN|nr:hypothetical protein NE237_017223 [Protea cynaroides]